MSQCVHADESSWLLLDTAVQLLKLNMLGLPVIAFETGHSPVYAAWTVTRR